MIPGRGAAAVLLGVSVGAAVALAGCTSLPANGPTPTEPVSTQTSPPKTSVDVQRPAGSDGLTVRYRSGSDTKTLKVKDFPR